MSGDEAPAKPGRPPGSTWPAGRRRRRDMTPQEREARKKANRERHAAEQEERQGRPPGRYVWEPFTDGNTAALKHGAGERVGRNPPKALVAQAEVLEAQVREYLGGAYPEQLAMPQFGPAVRSWARLEARTILLSNWLERLLEESGGDEGVWATPQRNGAVKTPFELWMAAERASAKARKDLGLDPASWASIQKDLGIAERNQADALNQLGRQGAGIRARRLRAVPGEVEKD